MLPNGTLRAPGEKVSCRLGAIVSTFSGRQTSDTHAPFLGGHAAKSQFSALSSRGVSSYSRATRVARSIYYLLPQLLTTCSRRELENILKACVQTRSQLFKACKVLPADKSLSIGLLLPRPIRSSSVCNISNTRKSGSLDLQTLRSGMKKRGAVEFFFFFNQLRSVWISAITEYPSTIELFSSSGIL